MAKETVDPETVISLALAGELLGVSRKRVAQLVQDGFIRKAGRGTTTIVAAVRGHARYWQDKAAEQTKGSADARVRDARAAEIEQRIAARKRELVPAAEALCAIDHVVAACAEAFAAIPAMITRDVAERTRIETQVKRAQADVAKRLGEAAKLLEEGGSLPDMD